MSNFDLFLFHSQDGVISKKSTSGNTLSDQAGGCGQGIVHELVESPTLSVIPNECFNRKAPDCTPPKKLKKRLLMCRRMHLGSILFRASLGLRKKKKHKKSKRRTLETQNLIKEHLLDNNCFSSEVGPSTSEKSLTISSGSKNSRKKQTKSVSRKADGVRKCFDDSLMHVADEELRKRNDRNGAVLPIDEQLQKSSISVSKANQQDARELDFLENSKRDVLQNRTMSILTQGLEEMTGEYFNWNTHLDMITDLYNYTDLSASVVAMHHLLCISSGTYACQVILGLIFCAYHGRYNSE